MTVKCNACESTFLSPQGLASHNRWVHKIPEQTITDLYKLHATLARIQGVVAVYEKGLTRAPSALVSIRIILNNSGVPHDSR